MPSYIDWIRKHVGHEKIPLIFASACICDNNGYLLWQRRADFGWWGLPGGILELGESLSECIVREVREETGLKVEPSHLIGIYSSPDFDIKYPNGDLVQQVTACFDCRIVGGRLRLDMNETLDLTWFPMDKMPYTAPWYMAMVNDLVLGQKTAFFDRGTPGKQRNSGTSFNQILEHIDTGTLLVPVVTAFIKDRNGYVMLQKENNKDKWKLPCFLMELGERIDQTLINGFQKETGSKVKATRLIGVYSHGGNEFCHTWGKNVKLVNVLFRCQFIPKWLHTQGIQSSSIRFFSFDALPSISEYTLRLLQDGLINREEAFF